MKKSSIKHISVLILSILFFSNITLNAKSDSSNKTKSFDLAIKNVHIFDSKSKKVLKDRTILINDDEIISIIDGSKKFNAEKTIQGKGRLVSPGFVDTHTHILQTYGSRNFDRNYKLEDEPFETYKKLLARQFLQNGVTTVVDMAQPEPWIEKTLELQKNPTPSFPNLFINGSSTISDLSWDRNPPLHHWKIRNAEEAKKKVQKYSKLGIKFMKLYWKLEENDMKNVVEEAKKHDITLNAHVDNNFVTIPQAMKLGVRNFEHFFTVTPSILNMRESYPKLNEKFGLSNGGRNIDVFAANMVFFFKYIDDNAELKTKMLELLTNMAKEKVSISTALNVLATPAKRSHTFSTFEFLPARNKPNTNFTVEQQKQLDDAFNTMMRYMKIAHDKGVKLRIGTDTRYGGKAFLSELMIFSESGFPVEDVLQIATINGAESMNLDDKFGSIEVGKKADLIIFDKNPFDDYKNFQSKKTVIKGGKLFQVEKSLAFSTLDKIKKDGIKKGLEWFNKHKKSGEYGSPDEAELNEIAFQLFANEQIEEGIAIYTLKKQIFPKSGKVYNYLTENDLNAFGYYIAGKNKNLDALEIFKFNAFLHPKSANVYDSLGEAYLNVKNNQLALKNYKRSIELNPQNYNAVQIVNELEGKEIDVDSKILDSYSGKYEFRTNVIWTIGIDGKKLTFQEVGQRLFTLEAISNERFVIPRANITVSFEKDSSGKIIGMIFNQGGRQLKAKRLPS